MKGMCRTVRAGAGGRLWIPFVLLAGMALAARAQKGAATAHPGEAAVRGMREEARRLEGFVTSELARRFLAAVEDLPAMDARTVFRDEATREWYSRSAAENLERSEREGLAERSLDGQFYYTTKYGTPLAYVRAMDLLAKHGVSDLAGKRVLDFGYGSVGHLRVLASLGADVVGVDVDTLLAALYSAPEDQGPVRGRHGRDGSIRLIHGHWPGDEAVKAAAGAGFDVFLSKNTLKRGYIHPAREVDPKRLVHLGVDDRAFVQAVFNALRPGGFVMVYNLSPAPAPADKSYIPWADGRFPFELALCESVGFRVLTFDEDDTEAARRMAHLLAWDEGEGAMDLENDLFGHYTILRKP